MTAAHLVERLLRQLVLEPPHASSGQGIARRTRHHDSKSNETKQCHERADRSQRSPGAALSGLRSLGTPP